MKVIILAGGRGTRLPHSAKDIPKALVAIGGKPILQHQIDLLESHGLYDIRLALGFRADQIVEYLNGKYEYVIEEKPLGTGGAVKFASHDLDEPFMVVNGDILTGLDVSLFKKAFGSLGQNMLAVSFCQNNTDFGLLELDESGRIMNFQEKPQSPVSGYVSVGFYILHPQIFANTRGKAFSIEYDIFPHLAKDGNLHGFEHKGFWIDLGTEERLVKGQEIMI